MGNLSCFNQSEIKKEIIYDLTTSNFKHSSHTGESKSSTTTEINQIKETYILNDNPTFEVKENIDMNQNSNYNSQINLMLKNSSIEIISVDDFFNKIYSIYNSEDIKEKLLNNQQTPLENDLYEIPPIKNKFGIYYGTVNKNAIKEGKGILLMNNNSLYIGNFMNNKFNGKGYLIDEQGNYYNGTFIDNVPNGEGEYYKINEYKLNGKFENNIFEGKEENFLNKFTYDGILINGQKNGKGVLIYDNKFKYVGDFKDDYFQGNGELIYDDNRKYIGNFNLNKFNGKGTFIWNNDNYYSGNYFENKKNGLGNYVWQNKRYFEGNFNNGHLNGKGIIYKDENKAECLYRNGKILYFNVN